MKYKKLFFALAVTIVLMLSSTSIDASAATKRKAKSKVTAVKKSTSKKKAVKKKSTAKKTVKKKTVKKTAKKSTRRTASVKRGNSYSRGSGSVLGSGDTARLVNYAKKYIGTRYVYGSSSSSGFDCSGFTMYVYRAAGINLPHSASSQSTLGLAVSKSNLRSGDLVFFETTGSGISHVGMCIGNNQFIHASSGSGHVTINSLSDSYYASRFRGAVRILN
jgi:cell wall-associated NlpC family hydrolase